MGTHRIAVVGDATSVAGFRLLGFAVYPVEHAADARDLWDEIMRAGFGAVFVTEPVYAELGERIAEVADSPVPAVTVIPAAGSPGGVGAAKLDRAIERALGTAVPQKEEEG